MEKKYLNIVMVEPEIPQNTGNVARLCACLGAKLFLCGRLGFSLSNKYLKRSGLDYWDKVDIEHLVSFEELVKNFSENENNYYFFTTKTDKIYTKIEYKEGDFLVFGPETRGLNNDILKKYENNLVTIPMRKETRSLNLSNSIAIGAYEVVRQLGHLGE